MPPSEEQASRLFKAAQAGDVEEFEAAAAAIEGDVRQLAAPPSAASCLHVAAHAGQTDMCKHLLDAHGFDVNAQDSGGGWQWQRVAD